MRNAVVVTLVVGAALAAGTLGAWLGQRAGRDEAAQGRVPAAAAKREVLYWYDPMYPQQKFEQPGKSPHMDMMLVPRYADEVGAADGVRIEPRLLQNLGVRTARATLEALARRVRTTGVVAFDEGEVAVVQARVDGIVERLHVRAPWTPVRRGQPLFTLLAPEWTAAQEEYLALRSADHAGIESLRAAARQRLVLLGMDEGAIRALERDGRARARSVVAAPRDGVLAELMVRDGAGVAAGTPMARINGLDPVWIEAAVPERDAALVAAGARASATLAALPGQRFEGTVAALLPDVDPVTRTLTARIVLANGDGRLVPGMYPDIEFELATDGREHVVVPSEAVIATGRRHVVIVAQGRGSFRAQEVRVGIEADGRSEILDGIADGEEVVLSGQFLIDSEASLTGALSRLGAAPGAERAP